MLIRMTFGATNYVNTYLVETDMLNDNNLKNAIDYCHQNSNRVGFSEKFGEYEVLNGQLLLDSFELESRISQISQSDLTPQIKVFIYE